MPARPHTAAAAVYSAGSWAAVACPGEELVFQADMDLRWGFRLETRRSLGSWAAIALGLGAGSAGVLGAAHIAASRVGAHSAAAVCLLRLAEAGSAVVAAGVWAETRAAVGTTGRREVAQSTVAEAVGLVCIRMVSREQCLLPTEGMAGERCDHGLKVPGGAGPRQFVSRTRNTRLTRVIVSARRRSCLVCRHVHV